MFIFFRAKSNVSSKAKKGTCVYCGSVGNITNDHIPPKALWAKPRPSDLKTIPSCHSCNKSFGQDDEYFRTTLAICRDVFDHEEIQKLLPSVHRSLERPEQKNFTRSIINSIRMMNEYTGSGLYIGRAPGYNVNLARLYRTIERIVIGLFFCESGRRLPSTHTTWSISLVTEKRIPIELAKVVNILFEVQPKYIGGKVFSYSYLFTTDDPNSSAWLMCFYEKIYFFGTTCRIAQ